MEEALHGVQEFMEAVLAAAVHLLLVEMELLVQIHQIQLMVVMVVQVLLLLLQEFLHIMPAAVVVETGVIQQELEQILVV